VAGGLLAGRVDGLIVARFWFRSYLDNLCATLPHRNRLICPLLLVYAYTAAEINTKKALTLALSKFFAVI
jgi:hypothetical protein